MFKPNRLCRVQTSTGANDVYGQPIQSAWTLEPCSVAKMSVTSRKSSVRAEQSASRGNAMELEADLKILFAAKSEVDIDDIILLDDYEFRVLGRQPRRDAAGRLDHIEITANIWSKA